MEVDADFVDRHRDTVKARRRVKLCFLALLCCVIMMVDLISDANATIHAKGNGCHVSMDASVELDTGCMDTDFMPSHCL